MKPSEIQAELENLRRHVINLVKQGKPIDGSALGRSLQKLLFSLVSSLSERMFQGSPLQSVFLPILLVIRTWAPEGQTPFFYHSLQAEQNFDDQYFAPVSQEKTLGPLYPVSTLESHWFGCPSLLKDLLKGLQGLVVLLWARATIHRRQDVKHLFFRRKVLFDQSYLLKNLFNF